jgi:hypothetical protein
VPPTGFLLTLGLVPAPAEIVDAVEAIEVESSLDEASVFRLRLGIAPTLPGDWTVLREDIFRPLLPVGIRVLAGVGVPEAVINGYVSQQHVTYADDPGDSGLEVTGMDATMLMNLQEKVMPWPNLPDAAIATAIFGQYGVVPKVQPTSPVLIEPEGTTIQRGTDIRFLRRLARRNGFDCYVQPEPVSGLDVGHFEPPTLFGVPQAVLNVALGDETNVSGFSVRYELTRPTTAVAATLDVTTKTPQPALAPASLEVPLGAEPALTRVLPPPISRPVGTGLARSGDLQKSAQAIADRSSFAVVAEGDVGASVGVLRPGGIVNVRGAGRVFNGSYLVSKVRHTIGDDGYTQHFEARRNAVTMTGAELFVAV